MATFTLACQILIGDLTLDRIIYGKVVSSMDTTTDTCTLKIPRLRRILYQDKEAIATSIKEGDPVEVYWGYRQKGLYKEFQGYVSKVDLKTPLVIECEDASYLFKKVNLEKSWYETTLKEVLNYATAEVKKVYPNSGITISNEVPGVTMKKFSLDNCTAFECLEKIKEEYGLVCYFIGNELFTGITYQQKRGEVIYSFTENVIKDDLERINTDERIRLRAVSITKDNKKIEVTVPKDQKTGGLRTKHYYNITSEKELERIALSDYSKLKIQSGMSGSLTGYHLPFCQHGYTAILIDEELDIRKGSFVVNTTECTFGHGIGIRRKVLPSINVNETL